MFFREKKTKTTPVLQLVESYRNNEGKVRQRIILSLGDCIVPDEYRKAVAYEITQRLAGYEQILPEDPVISHWVKLVYDRLEASGHMPEAVYRETDPKHGPAVESVEIDEIEHEDSRLLGPILVLNRAWESLEIDSILKRRNFSKGLLVNARLSVFNRLLEPCSENELPRWAATTAANSLFNVQVESWGEDRFYRISDRLLSVRNQLEEHLRDKEQEIFNLDRTILLYDLTNSYFEGTAKNNPAAKRSINSKEKRTDCPLISVGLVLDSEGFVLTHKVFRGNMSDCKTLVDAVQDLQKVTECKRPIVVVDGGIATEDNLKYLRDNGFDYIVNGKRQTRIKFAEDFGKTGEFRKITEREDKAKRPVFVKRIKADDEYVLLCRSEGRREKEDAIVEGAERRLLEGLEKMQARIFRNDPRLKLDKSAAIVNRGIGRLTARTTRASKYYAINFDYETRTLSWGRQEGLFENATDLHGCYHLRSNVDFPDQQLWKTYIMLTRVEDAFRMLKSDLGLRPFRHHGEDRTKGHIWITILAYHLLRWIEYNLELAGYEGTWNRVKRILQTHAYNTLIIPTQNQRVYRTRKAGKPNEAQRLIYKLLGVDLTTLPKRKRVYRRKLKN